MIAFILGMISSVAIGFGFELYKTIPSHELASVVPFMVGFYIVSKFLIKLVNNNWLKPNVRIIKQYDTEIGVEAVNGKRGILIAYKLSVWLLEFIPGCLYGWIFVCLVAMAN